MSTQFFWARVYGMRFTSVTDFATGTGPFIPVLIYEKLAEAVSVQAPLLASSTRSKTSKRTKRRLRS